jgi:hypothetical protein
VVEDVSIVESKVTGRCNARKAAQQQSASNALARQGAPQQASGGRG